MCSDISRIVTKRHKCDLLLVLIVTFSILTGTSTAQNFAPAVDYPAQTQPFGIAKADFNNDGNVDVVVANSGSQSLSLFLGCGDGAFAAPIIITLTPVPPVTVANPPQPVSVAAGDFNGDGNADIAVAFNGTSTAVQILFGNGDGTFQPGANQATRQSFTNFQLSAADFNEDGKLDLAAATDSGMLIMLNDGAGHFTATTSQPFPGTFTQHFAIGDLNNDGHLDLVAIIPNGAVQEAFGNGDGTFRPPVTIASPSPSTVTGLGSIALGDFNGDGRLDLVFTEFGNSSTGTPSAIHVDLQRLDGTFSGAQITLTPTFHPAGLLIGDFNGDGQPDIATLSGNDPADPSALAVYLGQSILKFSAPTLFSVSSLPIALLDANLTNTSALDLVTTNLNANTISVLVNHGANTLTLASSVNPSSVSQPVTLTAAVRPKFPGRGNLSGSVMFTDGKAILGTTPLNSSGSGSVTASFLNAGSHPLLAMFGGNSSFVASSATITQVVNKASTSITFNGSINPSSFGQSVVFSITVAGAPGGPAPTGTVNLLDGSSIILSGPLDNAGKAALSTSSLSVSNHVLTAQYPGDANSASATSSPLSQIVNKNASSTTLASTPNPSVFGQAITLTASVTGPAGTSGTPSGSVTFSDGTSAIGTSNLDSNGRATLSISSLSVGTHSINAAYAGDANFSGSSSAIVSRAVNKAATSSTLTASPNPSAFGQSVTFTATVAAQAGGGIPAGTVTFIDGTATLGTAVLDNTGKAILSLSTLSVGSHSIVASYSGDNNFTTSASSAVSQIVNKAASVTTLTANPNPSVFGQLVVLTATVAASGAGAGIPSGSVTFVDGTATIGTAALDKTGKAMFTVSSLSVGSHNIGASYGGDGNFNSSSASGTAGVNQVVSQSNTVTSITSSADPSVFGQAITLTASVTASGGGGGVPSGSVTFMDGTVAIGTTPLDSNGNASLTISSISSLGVGGHTITASYPGSGNYLPSHSGNLSQTVIKDSVSVALTSVPNPSTFGQAVTFTVKVAPSPPGDAPGTAIPGGTITFSDGTIVLGSVVLDSTGTTTLTISTLNAGSHTITASYGGDANFSKGSSSPYMQTVKQVATTTSLTTSMNPTTINSVLTLAANVHAIVGAPTGSVVFFDGGQQLGSSQIDGLGNAVLSVSSLSTGSHTLIATYSGDNNFASSQSSPVMETVLDSRNTVMLTSSANPQTVTKAVTFSATVTTAVAGLVNTGTVTFTNGASILSTVPVANSMARFTTKNLPVGDDSITAVYQVVGPFPGPSDGSATLVETISQATPIVVGSGNEQDFTLSVKPGQALVRAGNTVSAQVALVPVNGLSGVVDVSCTGVPQGSTCAIKPNVARFDGKNPIKATLVVTTSGPGSPPRRPHPPRRRMEGMAWLPLVPIAFGCVVIPTFKRKKGGLVAATILTALLAGCSDSTFLTMPLSSNTPPGSYTIIIQAASGHLAHSAQMKLIVH
jgi:hypothetical protein